MVIGWPTIKIVFSVHECASQHHVLLSTMCFSARCSSICLLSVFFKAKRRFHDVVHFSFHESCFKKTPFLLFMKRVKNTSIINGLVTSRKLGLVSQHMVELHNTLLRLSSFSVQSSKHIFVINCDVSSLFVVGLSCS